MNLHLINKPEVGGGRSETFPLAAKRTFRPTDGNVENNAAAAA